MQIVVRIFCRMMFKIRYVFGFVLKIGLCLTTQPRLLNKIMNVEQ